MKLRESLIGASVLLSLLFLWSCNKGEVTIEKKPPKIGDQSFTVVENADEFTVIGTVAATDEEGQLLLFSITKNSSDLFEITEAGAISLQEGKSLDIEKQQKHEITVEVSNGKLFAEAMVTITVRDTQPFVTRWQTTSAKEPITIPTNENLSYNYTVDWGDGNVEESLTSNAMHVYADAGTYTISITGAFPAIQFGNDGDKEKIISIDQWGDIAWESFEAAFEGCANLTYTAIDNPDLSRVESMHAMFKQASMFNGHIDSWDVGTVVKMGSMFSGATAFNQALGPWDVSNVNSMSSMFSGAISFDQDIRNWDVSEVANMSSMFYLATSFNQPIRTWDVSSVWNMESMFSGAISFNQDLSTWDTANVGLCNDFNDDGIMPRKSFPTLGCFAP